MKIAVFTQDEQVYLPIPIERVVESNPDQVACIVLSPPMSTHGGGIKGLMKHLPVFGFAGTLRMGFRVIWSRVAPRIGLKPKGRKHWTIADIARSHNIPLYLIADVNSEEMHNVISKHPADMLVSVSCPQVLRPKTLHRFKHGGINVHSAPLPKYRGLLPSFWVLHNGETKTAVSVHELGEQLDNGDILHQQPIPIAKGETWNSLLAKTKTAAGDALVEAIEQVKNGTVIKKPNRDEDSTYFSFPTSKDAREFRRRGLRMF